MTLTADDASSLVVLAGGEGRRMGLPKSQLYLGDHPILQHLLDVWNWHGPTLLGTAPGREHPPGWQLFDCEVTDPVAGAGPLVALATAMQNITTDLAVVTPVDMPGLRASHLRWMIEALKHRPDKQGIMCARRVEGQERIEPFPAAFRKSASALIQDWLEKGYRSLHSLLKNEDAFALVDPDWDASAWVNLNEPDQLSQYGASLIQGKP